MRQHRDRQPELRSVWRRLSCGDELRERRLFGAMPIGTNRLRRHLREYCDRCQQLRWVWSGLRSRPDMRERCLHMPVWYDDVRNNLLYDPRLLWKRLSSHAQQRIGSELLRLQCTPDVHGGISHGSLPRIHGRQRRHVRTVHVRVELGPPHVCYTHQQYASCCVLGLPRH